MGVLLYINGRPAMHFAISKEIKTCLTLGYVHCADIIRSEQFENGHFSRDYDF